MSSALELVSTFLTLWAVWLIGVQDVRGQYRMLAAQVGWGVFAALGGHWALLAQSVVLLGLTVRAIVFWRRAASQGQARAPRRRARLV